MALGCAMNSHYTNAIQPTWNSTTSSSLVHHISSLWQQLPWGPKLLPTIKLKVAAKIAETKFSSKSFFSPEGNHGSILHRWQLDLMLQWSFASKRSDRNWRPMQPCPGSFGLPTSLGTVNLVCAFWRISCLSARSRQQIPFHQYIQLLSYCIWPCTRIGENAVAVTNPLGNQAATTWHVGSVGSVGSAAFCCLATCGKVWKGALNFH